MSFDPYAPYGPLVETTMRIVCWNVWGRFGEWEARQAGIEDVLAATAPDVVCLAEAWATPDTLPNLCRRCGPHHRTRWKPTG